MKKFEYKEWIIAHASSKNVQKWQGGVVRYVNGVEVPDWKNGLRLHEALTAAGDEGWELVSVTINGDNTTNSPALTYIFKRPIAK